MRAGGYNTICTTYNSGRSGEGEWHGPDARVPVDESMLTSYLRETPSSDPIIRNLLEV